MRFFQRILFRSSPYAAAAALLPAMILVAAVAGGRGARDKSDGGNGITSESNIDSLIRDANSLSRSFAEISDSMARLLNRINTKPVSMPLDGWLSSKYAHRRLHPITSKYQPHLGIDVAAPRGSAITAPGAGRILRVARVSGYGLLVEVDHGDGIVTRYGHCARVLVKAGAQVVRGQVIATVGNSGLSTGPHLHYEILYNGKAVDPLIFIN